MPADPSSRSFISLTDTEWGKLAAYLDDALEPAEQAEVERWIAASPERVALVGQMRGVFPASIQPTPVWDVEAAFAQFSTARTRKPSLRAAARPTWYRWAAPVAAATVCIAAVFGYRHLSHTVRAADAGQVYAAAVGERVRTQLSDGTIVVLAPGTRLQLGDDFGGADRHVTLDGQAYFDIAHARQAPFTITTTHSTTRVLGTRFNVKAFAQDGVVEVTVLDGRVAVDDTVVLSGGEGMRRDPVGSVQRYAAPDVARMLAWTNGELVFQDTPLLMAISSLERWYGIHVHLADATLASRLLTATFRDTDRVTDVLDVLSRTLGASFTQRGRDVALYDLRTESSL